MAVADSGSWKLIIYPIIVIFIVGAILNFTVKPFADDGINAEKYNTQYTLNLWGTISNESITIPANNTNRSLQLTGTEYFTNWLLGLVRLNPLNIENHPDGSYTVTKGHNIFSDFLTFINEQIYYFSYIPLVIQIPLIIVLAISIAYGLYVMFAMLIP